MDNSYDTNKEKVFERNKQEQESKKQARIAAYQNQDAYTLLSGEFNAYDETD